MSFIVGSLVSSLVGSLRGYLVSHLESSHMSFPVSALVGSLVGSLVSSLARPFPAPKPPITLAWLYGYIYGGFSFVVCPQWLPQTDRDNMLLKGVRYGWGRVGRGGVR